MNKLSIEEAIKQVEKRIYRQYQGSQWIVCFVDEDAGVIRNDGPYDYWRARAIVRESRITDVLLLTGAAETAEDVVAILARADNGEGSWKDIAWDLAKAGLED